MPATNRLESLRPSADRSEKPRIFLFRDSAMKNERSKSGLPLQSIAWPILDVRGYVPTGRLVDFRTTSLGSITTRRVLVGAPPPIMPRTSLAARCPICVVDGSTLVNGTSIKSS